MAHNVLIICSDEHWRDTAGCYGHPMVQTPHLDRLAASGTTYTRAYSAFPCCVSARASMQTGRWVHQLGTWSSAEPYDGTVPGWGHRLQAHDRPVVSVGKLHFRSTQDDNGFSEEIIPVHVVNGIGFTSMMVRDGVEPYPGTEDFARSIGRGESSYTRYDRRVCELACAWLTDAAARQDQPWTLFVSFVAPHYPVIAPDAFHDLYPQHRVDLPRLRAADERPDHPVLDAWQTVWDFDRYFRDDDHLREVRAAYYGLVSFLDDNVGKVLAALAESGQADDTLVVYTSDHGEMLGNHGLWTKMTMYEESVAIPLIVSGPGAPAGRRCHVPASHVDLHPTILAAHDLRDDDPALPGIALQDLAREGDEERAIISEYHERGAITGMFMLRWRNWKYIAYPGYPPQLFDLDRDPIEARDLAGDPASSSVLAACDARLREILDPDSVNRRAFADQASRIDALGGRAKALDYSDLAYTPMPA